MRTMHASRRATGGGHRGIQKRAHAGSGAERREQTFGDTLERFGRRGESSPTAHVHISHGGPTASDTIAGFRRRRHSLFADHVIVRPRSAPRISFFLGVGNLPIFCRSFLLPVQAGSTMEAN